MRRLFVVTVLAVAAASPVSALVTGTVVGPGASAVPIAIVAPIDGGGAAEVAERFASVLARDLDLSGLFAVVDPARHAERPPNVSLRADATDFGAWAAAGAHVLVKSSATRAGDRVTLEVRSFDVGTGEAIVGGSRRFAGGVGETGRMAHRVADALLEYLTGVRGPFDSQIVFTSTRGGPLKDLYRFTFDAAPHRMTREPSLALTPRWHPSGRRVLFTSYRRHVPGLFELQLPAGRVRPLVAARVPLLGGAWSPDGAALAVAREQGGNTDLFLLDPNGKAIRRLTDHWSVDVSPSWAPDGRRLAFCSARSGSPQIYVMHADGSGLRRVSFSGGYNTSPAWSPTGQHLAWASRVGGMQSVVADAEGRGARAVTRGVGNEDPAWGPGGRYLVYTAPGRGGRRLMLTDRDGRMHRELTVGPGSDTSPSWARWAD